MVKSLKRFITVLMTLVLALSVSVPVFAEETISPDNREYLIVNGSDIVYVGEDYENPDTGEYIHWDNYARSVDKNFTFKMRYSVTSSSFTAHSTKVLVIANAHVEDLNGNIISGYTGHLYTVSIVGWYSRNLQFSVGSAQSGTITGLENGGSYKVQITNSDYLVDTRYLVGSGSVSTL
jgi:hypothetical protein